MASPRRDVCTPVIGTGGSLGGAVGKCGGLEMEYSSSVVPREKRPENRREAARDAEHAAQAQLALVHADERPAEVVASAPCLPRSSPGPPH